MEIKNNTHQENDINQSSYYNKAISWGKWFVELPGTIYSGMTRASYSILNYSINGSLDIMGRVLTSPAALIFTGTKADRMKCDADYYTDATKDGNYIRHQVLEMTFTKAWIMKDVTLLPFGVERFAVKKDAAPSLDDRIEDFEINDETRKQCEENIFPKEVIRLYRYPYQMIMPCNAKHFADAKFYDESRPENLVMYIVPIINESNDMPHVGVHRVEMEYKPLLVEVKNALEATNKILEYFLKYQSGFFCEELNESTLRVLKKEADVQNNRLHHLHSKFQLEECLQEIKENKSQLNRMERRKEERDLKKRAKLKRNFDIPEDFFPKGEDSHEKYKAEVINYTKQLHNMNTRFIDAIDSMRICPMNVYNVYLVLLAIYSSKYVSFNNPYSWRYLNKVASVVSSTAQELALNLCSIAETVYKELGGKIEIIRDTNTYLEKQLIFKCLTVVRKSQLPLHIIEQQRQIQLQKALKKRAKTKQENTAEEKVKTTQMSSAENWEKREIDLPTEDQPVKSKKAKKEKKQKLSTAEMVRQNVKKDKAEKEEIIIEKVAQEHVVRKDNDRMLVSHEEFRAIYMGLSAKNKQTYDNIMNAEHLVTKNDDISDLISALADVLENILGEAVAQEVRKIKPHNAHRSKDTGKLQPANFLKILRPRLIFLGLFDQKNWNPVTPMDHDAYSKFLNQRLHETLNAKGIYEKGAAMEYLKLNPELLSFAK